MSDSLYNTVMKNGEATLWTIEELGERWPRCFPPAMAVCRVGGCATFRTCGRSDTTPRLACSIARRRCAGRTALYGQRHLLQLVAIKRLQARGLSLAAVQERVVGLSNAALRRLAEAVSPGEKELSTSSRAGVVLADTAGRGTGTGRCGCCRRREEEGSGIPKAIPLGDGLVLSLVTGRALDDEDLRVIRMAAAPLIELLRLRGLIGPADIQMK